MPILRPFIMVMSEKQYLIDPKSKRELLLPDSSKGGSNEWTVKEERSADQGMVCMLQPAAGDKSVKARQSL